MSNAESSQQVRIVIEETGPSLETFFAAPHSLDASEPSRKRETLQEAEARLGVGIPDLLRNLYLKQDGGSTDYFLLATAPDAQHLYEGDDSVISKAYSAWMTGLPGYDIKPLDSLNSLAFYADQTDFGDEEWDWRNRISGTDRLIVISNHGWSLWCCLDYREGHSEPKIVYFDDRQMDDPEIVTLHELAPDFASFFARLRQHGIIEEDGRLMRGLRQL